MPMMFTLYAVCGAGPLPPLSCNGVVTKQPEQNLIFGQGMSGMFIILCECRAKKILYETTFSRRHSSCIIVHNHVHFNISPTHLPTIVAYNSNSFLNTTTRAQLY